MSTAAITHPDVLLMVEVRDGNLDAFDVLVERYRNDLVGYLCRIVQSRAVAEELAQDTFLRVFHSRERYEPTARFSSWLYTIATRLAWNWIRHNGSPSRHESIESVPLYARPRQFRDPRPLTDAAMIHADRMREVQRAVAELPLRQRTAVVMHKYQEMSYEQIAAALDCSTQAVKSLLFRAYSMLRVRLAHTMGESVEEPAAE